MTARETVTPADLAAVDEAARVLARAARAMGATRVTLNVFAEGIVAMVALPADTPDWQDVTHLDRGELPSAALARRLGVETEQEAMRARIFGRATDKPLTFAMIEEAERSLLDGRAEPLTSSGLPVVDSELTPAGRAYLAGAATTTTKEPPR